MFELIGRFLDKLASGCLVVVIALVILIAAIIVLFSYPLFVITVLIVGGLCTLGRGDDR